MAKFSKRHYLALAQTLAQARSAFPIVEERTTIDYVSANLAKMLERDNPRFDSGKFLNACQGDTP